MLLIQIFLVVIIGFLIFELFLKLKRKEIGVLNFCLWFLFWSGAFLISLFPNLSSSLARILGIGRGVDLIIYLSLILIFYFIFSFEVRLRKTDQKIEKIVRFLSLKKDDEKN